METVVKSKFENLNMEKMERFVKGILDKIFPSTKVKKFVERKN